MYLTANELMFGNYFFPLTNNIIINIIGYIGTL